MQVNGDGLGGGRIGDGDVEVVWTDDVAVHAGHALAQLVHPAVPLAEVLDGGTGTALLGLDGGELGGAVGRELAEAGQLVGLVVEEAVQVRDGLLLDREGGEALFPRHSGPLQPPPQLLHTPAPVGIVLGKGGPDLGQLVRGGANVLGELDGLLPLPLYTRQPPLKHLTKSLHFGLDGGLLLLDVFEGVFGVLDAPLQRLDRTGRPLLRNRLPLAAIQEVFQEAALGGQFEEIEFQLSQVLLYRV